MGNSIGPNTSEFNASKDGLDLYLSAQHFSYEIVVTKETRAVYHPIFTYLMLGYEERYVATVRAWDIYDFDLKSWDGFGNILNNMAYIAHQFEIGEDYFWDATYTEATDWCPAPYI